MRFRTAVIIAAALAATAAAGLPTTASGAAPTRERVQVDRHVGHRQTGSFQRVADHAIGVVVAQRVRAVRELLRLGHQRLVVPLADRAVEVELQRAGRSLGSG